MKNEICYICADISEKEHRAMTDGYIYNASMQLCPKCGNHRSASSFSYISNEYWNDWDIEKSLYFIKEQINNMNYKLKNDTGINKIKNEIILKKYKKTLELLKDCESTIKLTFEIMSELNAPDKFQKLKFEKRKEK